MFKQKLFVFLLIFLGITTKAMSQDVPLKDNISTFLKKHCVFKDPNSTRQAESDSVSVLIVDILNGDTSRETQNRMMQLYLENSVSVFEDMTDVMRYDHRRLLSLISIILYVDEMQFRTFVADAQDYLKSINEDYQEKNELLLRLTYLYKLYSLETLYTDEVDLQLDIIDEILVDKPSNDSFYDEYQILFNEIVSTSDK